MSEVKNSTSFVITSLRVAVVLLSLYSIALAAVVVTTSLEVGGVPAASGIDLLQTQFSSVVNSGLDNRSGTQPESRLRDGDGSDTTPGPRVSDGDSVTYYFDVSSNTGGYNISSIDIFLGHWGTGRTTIDDLDIHFSTVSDDTDFSNVILLGGSSTSFNVDPYDGRVRVDDGGANLARRVAAVRITFNAVQNGWSTLYEIDIIGSSLIASGTIFRIE